MNMESIYEYGSRAGFWRLHRMFTERNDAGDRLCRRQRVGALSRNRPQPMKEAGWEIATHGYKWIDYRDTPAEKEAQDISEAIKGFIPKWSASGRSGSIRAAAPSTRCGSAWRKAASSICADTYADDLPSWALGPRGPQLIVPYTLDTNDMRFATPQGFNSGNQFFAYLKDSFDTLYAEGTTGEDAVDRAALPAGRAARTRGVAGAFSRLCARPRKSMVRDPAGYRQALDRQASATGRLEAVAADAHPLRRAIRRHLRASRWVAEAAYDAGLTSADDSAEVRRARWLRRWARGATSAKRTLIQAHPDLAGSSRSPGS